MPVRKKFFGDPQGNANITCDDEGNVTIRSKDNCVAVTPDGTSIANPMLETASTKKVFSRETPWPLSMIPVIPSDIPMIPFAAALATIAVIASQAGALASLNISSNVD